MYDSTLHSPGFCTEKRSIIDMDCIHFIYQFHRFCGVNARSVIFILCTLTHTRHTRRFDCPMSSLIPMTMDNNKWYCGSPKMQVSQSNPQKNWKFKNHMLCNKHNICAEYLGMVTKAPDSSSGTSGVRPVCLSSDSWQTRVGLVYHTQVFCTDLNLYICNLWNWQLLWVSKRIVKPKINACTS